MNYNLNIKAQGEKKTSSLAALKSLLQLMSGERSRLLLASFFILVNSTVNLLGPFIVGITIDRYVQHRDFSGVLRNAGILLLMYSAGLSTSYLQTRLMGGFGQRMLFTLRNAVFSKLQELPVAFFNQNKAGDLISRVNNDTDRLNQFFSQSLMQFVSSLFIMTGAAICLLLINFPLGLAALSPALLLWVFHLVTGSWVKSRNTLSAQTVGGLSAEIQESLHNFKVVIAFNRRDYFRKRFDIANQKNYKASIGAGIANNLFLPVYGFAASLGQLIVLSYGVYQVLHGHFTVGLLISFFSYSYNFYSPLRQLAALWANFQVAMAGWDRITRILSLRSDLETLPATSSDSGASAEGLTAVAGNGAPALVEFRDVSFRYPDSKDVLHHINFRLESGKTYALVGPTGGGKTTTASLIARLYDPAEGIVLLDGRDLRTYGPEERSRQIGFILQDPFLFSGTVRENLLYGNEHYKDYSIEQLTAVIREANLDSLLSRFDGGLDMKVSGADGISLGQKQLIAFMRAVLRNPRILILDEATANIDTVTEKLLEDILQKLPETTTRVIIAHRLNTIENADEIFFVNAGEIVRAGNLEHAVDMLMRGKRAS